MHGHTLRWTMLIKVRRAVRDQRREALAEVMKLEQLLTHRLRMLDMELIERTSSTEEVIAGEQVVIEQKLDTNRSWHSLSICRGALKKEIREVLDEIDRRQQALMAAEAELQVMENLAGFTSADRLTPARLAGSETDAK